MIKAGNGYPFPAFRLLGLFVQPLVALCPPLCAILQGRGGKYPSRKAARPVGANKRDSRKGHLERLNALPTSFLRCCFCQKRPCPVRLGRVQDKSRASQVTPGRSKRPAVRTAFRAFTGQGRGSRNRLESLAGVCFWRHFQAGKLHLASDLPQGPLFWGGGTASVLPS